VWICIWICVFCSVFSTNTGMPPKHWTGGILCEKAGHWIHTLSVCHTHAQIDTYTHTHTHAHTHTHLHKHTHIHTHAHTHSHTHAGMPKEQWAGGGICDRGWALDSCHETWRAYCNHGPLATVHYVNIKPQNPEISNLRWHEPHRLSSKGK